MDGRMHDVGEGQKQMYRAAASAAATFADAKSERSESKTSVFGHRPRDGLMISDRRGKASHLERTVFKWPVRWRNEGGKTLPL